MSRFAEVAEIVDINREDMILNRELTDDLIADEILINLGYNRKRDRDVKKQKDSKLDYIIFIEGKMRIGMKVFGLSESIVDSEEYKSILSEYADKKMSVIIFTDGEKIIVHKYNKNNSSYSVIMSIDVHHETTDRDNDILSHIEKGKFNVNELDKYLKEVPSREDIERVIAEKSYDVAVTINSLLGNKYEVKDIEEIVKRLSSDDEIIDVLKARIESEEIRYNEMCESTESTIKQLEDEIAELKSKVSYDKSSAENDDIDKYREQIRQLHLRISKVEEERDEALSVIDELKKEIDETSVAELNKAERLLNLIEDNPEDDRLYVAVINEEIIQYDDIHTFIGRCLQKLYELKNYEASQHIFNGDIYKIIPEAKFNDLVMGNKTYDIMLLSNSEDTELNKLRMIFSKFECITFMCKKIGTLREPIDKRYAVYKKHNEEEIQAYADDDIGIDFGDESQKSNIKTFDGTSEIEGFDDENVEMQDAIVAHTLGTLDIGSIEEHYTTTKYKRIRYVCCEDHTMEVDCLESDNYNTVFCKTLEAILAAYSFTNPDGLVLRLRKNNLSEGNRFIRQNSRDITGEYSVIGGTRYVVQDLTTLDQVMYLIISVCSKINVDLEAITVYLECSTNNKAILDNHTMSAFGIEDRVASDTKMFESGEDDETALAIIKGDLLNNIAITKSSLEVHRDIFIKCIEIRSEYMKLEVDGYESVLEAIVNIVKAANDAGRELNFNSIGNLIGENYKLISDSVNDVTEDFDMIDVDGRQLYVSKIDDWRVVHSIIKMHTALFNNVTIAAKVIVNSNAVQHYTEEFDTYETALALSVNSIAWYVKSHKTVC